MRDRALLSALVRVVIDVLARYGPTDTPEAIDQDLVRLAHLVR